MTDAGFLDWMPVAPWWNPFRNDGAHYAALGRSGKLIKPIFRKYASSPGTLAPSAKLPSLKGFHNETVQDAVCTSHINRMRAIQ